jgi:histidinol-phosphate aminotransferase
VKFVALDDKLVHDLDAMKAAITDDVKLVYLCNPNNPTATIYDADKARAFIKSLPEGVVTFVDEAYLELADDFEKHTLVDLVHEGYPVIVSRTFSKLHALAGLRVGYGIATPELAEKIGFYKMASPNLLGIAAATASFQDKAFQEDSKKKIAAGRKDIETFFDAEGHAYTESHTNFVFFQTGLPIQKFQADMKEKGILVGRPFPPKLDWCRLTIGTPEEMTAFKRAFKQVMSA